MKKLEIVCLCGSTRFKEAFIQAKLALENAGVIVMTVECFAHADRIPLSPPQKALLDILHLGKINISDWVYVLNPGGYIGESTQAEIEYAIGLGKLVKYLEPRTSRRKDEPDERKT